MTLEEAKEKQFEIQSSNSKKVKFRPGKSKENLRKKGYTEEEIKKVCLTMVNVEYWTDRGYSLEDSIEKIKDHQSNASKYVDFKNRLLPSNKEYWMNKGFSEEESIRKVSDSQRTFTKEKCIEKFGEIKGMEIFNERTRKWLESLIKNGNLMIGYSKMSQVLFNEIKSKIKRDCKYATNGGEFKILKPNGGYYIYDFVDLKKMKIIEYNGDMYHGNPQKYKEDDNPHPFRKNLTAKMIWDKDKEKIELAKFNGFDVLIVWDSEFRYLGESRRSDVIQKCIDFLNS